MKAFIISGSRNPNGQTAKAAHAFMKGFTDAGGEAEIVFLPALKIERCRQCEDSGWGICISEGKCVIEDDFAKIAEKLWEADIVALANPVYYADLSESLRAFLDRFRRVRWSKVSVGSGGMKPAVLMCVAGGGGGGAPECIESMLRNIRASGLEAIEKIPARRQDLDEKAVELYELGKKLAVKR